MDGVRRLYGWPDEWPGLPGEGHFKVSEAEWLDGDESTPLQGVSFILIPADEVGMVEFMETKFSADLEN